MNKPSQLNFSTLLASSVHDIKNSVNMLLHSLDELIDEIPSELDNNKQKFSVLRGESSRINNALISLLGIYRLDQQQISPSVEEIYVKDFLEDEIAAQQLLFKINDVNVELDCDEDLLGYFDHHLITGVVSNVLVNCAKYTQDTITLAAFHEDNYLIIEIRDNGQGYPQHILDLVDNHERGIDFSTGSTNLGLFFARQIANIHINKEHCGDIELGNAPEGGGVFRLLLP